MESLSNLFLGFTVSLSPVNLMYCFIGVVLGTVVGVLPGLGASATIALLLPITFYIQDTSAIIMLAGIWYGSMYGGSITSILLRIPGEAASVVTCLDGYQMAKKGRAGVALGISAFGSFIAGTLGIVGLMLLAPPLAEFSLRFGPPEYFALTMLGLTLVAYLAQGSMIKAILMSVLGLVLSMVGLDPVRSMARFTYNSLILMNGLELVPIAMGLFGISEVLSILERKTVQEEVAKPPKGLLSLLPNRKDWRDSAVPMARGTVLGFLIGIIPGGGAIISSFASYAVEKRVSKHPERFGTGAIEAVAAPESANNAATAGGFIPLLTLGIPSNVITALMLGALMLHGVTPGPTLLTNRPDMFWGVVTSMYIGNAMLLVLNLPLIGLFTKIAKVPEAIMGSIITLVCLIGAYGVNNNPMDILVMVVFGILGYLMKKFKYEPAPFLLAFILGPMIEISLRQSLIVSRGSFMIFFSRPISAVLLGLAILLLVTPAVRRYFGLTKGGEISSSEK
jgi:putative tricarboxylic transport membrane protein